MRLTFVLTTLFLSCAFLHAQNAPIKMGLWEKTVVSSGGATPGAATLKAKSCITPETWQEMVANASKQHEGCTSNNVKNAHGYTFDATCKFPPDTTLVIHGSTTIQDSEHIVSESHSTSTANGKKRESDSRSVSRFLGANCGSVKPGEPEIEDN